MESWFPEGVSGYLIGGTLIGLAVAVTWLVTGHIAGLSSFLTAAQSWWSRRPYFRRAEVLAERRWKTVLVVGLIAGAALHTIFAGGGVWVTEVAWWRLLAGGALVGLGTRIGRGCTSGHGICGMSALAPPSIAATFVFMAVAIVTARLVSMAGITP